MIAKGLERCLHDAFVAARAERHELITVEHLLLGLLDEPSAADVLRACGANMQKLREYLHRHVDQHTPKVPADREVDTQPSLGFQRVIQQAIFHQQSSRGQEVTGADTLVAIFDEKDSYAARLLTDHGIARSNVTFHHSHGSGPSQDLPDAAELQVVLYNDHYTPMQFVIDVLQKFFSMTEADAKETMLEVHRDGIGLCGVYARNDALDLRKAVLDYARQHGHPLNCGVLASKLP